MHPSDPESEPDRTAETTVDGARVDGARVAGDAPVDEPPHESLAHELADYAELEVRELAELAEEGQEPEAKPKRWWVLPLRIVISLAMLAILFRRIPDFEWSKLVPDWHSAALFWLALALGLTLAAVVLSAWRWQQVLHALDIRPPFRNLVSYYFAGQFVSNVLPTTIGGDVLRISRLSRDEEAERGEPAQPTESTKQTPSTERPSPEDPAAERQLAPPTADRPPAGSAAKAAPSTIDAAETFASVVLERLTGWLVLPLLTFTGLALNPELRSLDRATSLAVLIALGTLGGLALILVAAGNPRIGGRLGRKEGWRRFIDAVHLGVGRLRHRPPAALSVLAVGIAFQLVLVLAAAAAAESLGLDIGVTVLLAFYPAVLISQVLPIGISGLGVRESAFVIFLSPLGVQPEQAVALGLLLYVLNLAASLAGAPAFTLGTRRRARP